MKKLVLFLILISLSAILHAQERPNRGLNNKIIRGPYETNRFFDNWILGVGGGVNVYNGNSDAHLSLEKRISTAVDLSVGKWITPSIGLRLQCSGLDAKGSSSFESDYATSSLGDGYYNEKFNIINLHGDIMWNLSNAISGYREDRRWNFIPYAGVGWARSWNETTNHNEYATSVGLLNTIRLSNVLDFTIDGRYMITSNRLDGANCGSNYDGMISATVGLIVKFGKRNFKRATTPNYSSYNKRISTLQNENKQLETKSTALAKELQELSKREKAIIIVTKNNASTTVTPVALFFKIGRTSLDNKELANLGFYVRNAMKTNENKTFTIIGTADSATGNDQINQRLSEHRMQYVYEILVNKYNISPARLIKKAEGSSNNRFENAELNRTVIIK